MRLSHVSSQSVSSALRYAMVSKQRHLTDAQKEVVTGQLADPALTLGAKNGKRVSLQREIERISAIMETNRTVATRMTITQSAMGQMDDVLHRLRETLTTAISGGANPAVVVSAANTALADINAALNTSYDGGYVFSGVNSDVKPIADYQTGGVSAAVNSAFQTWFGFPKTDPQAGFVTGAQMDAFMTAQVDPLFLGAGWTGLISSASSDPIQSRITLSERLETSVSANEVGFRKALFAAALSAEFFGGSLGAGAKSAVALKAVTLAGEASGELAAVQGRTGFIESRVSGAQTLLELQSGHLSALATDMAAVDPYEASTRLTSVLTQIEASYALTARIQNLSLMRYLT
jgi:flagellar hook-associated protein 3 FlgL